MKTNPHATVYIVDDDAGVREALAWLLRSRRLVSECFESAEAFDAHISAISKIREPSCVLLDVRMAGLSGLAMFEKLITYGIVLNESLFDPTHPLNELGLESQT